MSVQHEVAFETEICEYLAGHGWAYSENAEGYDRDLAMFPADLLGWLQETQAQELAEVIKPGASAQARGRATARILKRIARVLSTEPINGGGTLNVLKRPVNVTPARFTLFQARPATGLNEAVTRRYGRNRLRVMRQVSYSTKNGNRLDLVLFVNGLPVATVELKTDLTQSAAAALKQYARDRPPAGEPLLEFGRGALVHFVVSNELVYMTTRLDGANTRFLPFNRGYRNGAGNPPAAGTSPTAYFWEETLQRDTWLDLIGRFLHYRFDEKTDPITGAKSYATSLRFPRYHQWRAVTRLEQAAREEGPGHNYLIQHSAGSGKTDSIAWTAHRMASLHRADGTKVFDGVLVISDRTVLDGQLQRAVEQLESKAGVFQAITAGRGGSKSAQLAAALLSGKQIIGVTLQTFPFALDAIQSEHGLRERTYAIIADEAHSSQSGEAAAQLKQVLTAPGTAADAESGEGADVEDVLADVMARKAGVGTLSFFAFTATPKGKTIELFGREDPTTGVKREFDLYPMKQAIQEGFILDVLKNYVSYDLAFTLAHAVGDKPDIEVDVAKANSQLMRWVRLHPHNIAQKVQIIIEHFRQNVRTELGGRAKAMIVTGSRKEAVRYKLAVDAYLAEHGLAGRIGALVAFSGTVFDPDSGPGEFSETSMNPGLRGRSLAKAFAGGDHQVMIVADKFQTGFDQPLLVGMYIDKKLSGITAVQTLSRLNRVIPGKENTYVLDFVNDPGEILRAFQTYYEEAELQQPSDPDIVHDMLAKLDAAHIIDEHDVEQVVKAWLTGHSHNRLYSHIKASRDVFWDRWRTAAEAGDDLEKGRLEEFRGTVSAFVRTYDFLSQIIDYGDTRVEKWAIFLRVYRRTIERDADEAAAIVTDDIVLTHYRLRRQEQRELKLGEGETDGLKGVTDAGSGRAREPKYGPLQAVIDQINQLFSGSGVEEVDQVGAVEAVTRHLVENHHLQSEAMANTRADFSTSPSIEIELEDVVYAAAAGNSGAFKALLQLDSLKPLVPILLGAGIYERLRTEAERIAG